MPTQPSVGAALAYTRQVLGGLVNEVDNVIAVGTTAVTVLNGNGDRVGAVLVNMGIGTVYFNIDAGVGAANGVPVAPGGSIALVLPYDFTLCSRQWYAKSDVGGPYNVLALEYSRMVQD